MAGKKHADRDKASGRLTQLRLPDVVHDGCSAGMTELVRACPLRCDEPGAMLNSLVAGDPGHARRQQQQQHGPAHSSWRTQRPTASPPLPSPSSHRTRTQRHVPTLLPLSESLCSRRAMKRPPLLFFIMSLKLRPEGVTAMSPWLAELS
jgi:hypothetical protein